MSQTAPTRPAAGVDLNVVTLMIWAGLALVFALPLRQSSPFDLLSTDDAMRLVEVRDLLAGQHWFDLFQHRLNPPAGLPMHWSRLVDAPLALMILALRPFIGTTAAEAVTIVAWPLLLIGPALFFVGRIARHLAGPAAGLAALILAAMSLPALVHYQPGSIDHHNLQIVLTLGLTYGAMRLEDGWRYGLLAGLCAALSLAVGLEMLPALAAVGAVVALMTVLRGPAMAGPARSFGLALAGCTALLSAVLVPPGSYGDAVSDALGGPILLLAVGAGLALLGLAVAARRLASPIARAAVGLACLAPTLAAFVLLFPDSLHSPYGTVDPLVDKLWLHAVSETISVSQALRKMPQESFAIFGFPILAMGAGALCLWRCGPRIRLPFAVASAAVLAHFAVSLWEVRGASAAALAAAPVLAAGIVLALEARRLTTTLRVMLATLLVSPVSLLCAGGAFAAFAPAPPAPESEAAEPKPCPRIADAAPLAGLPQGRVMAFIDLGPAILATSSHSVYAAPFHRNNDGNSAMFRIMMGSAEEARSLLQAKGADYLAICPGSPEQANITKFAPDGLAARLARGESLEFLQPISLPGPGLVKAWRVAR